MRKVAEGKLSPCFEIIYNARIPTHQALRIIGEGMNAAAHAKVISEGIKSAKAIGKIKLNVADASVEHDHYLYGRKKRIAIAKRMAAAKV